MTGNGDGVFARKLGNIRLGALLQVVIAGMFVVSGVALILLVRQHMRQQALAEARSKARILLDRNLATHTYFTHQLKPSLFEWSEPSRDEGYFDPVWMSSTYAVREIDKYFQVLNPAEYYYKECAINARSPENEADAYEREFLEDLNQDPDLTERSVVRTLDGEPTFVTLRRGEAMEESCLRCHSTPEAAPQGLVDVYGPERSFGREVGEVVSAISIRVPLAEAYGEADRFAGRLSLMLVAILIGLFVVQSWLGQELLFGPLDVLRGKALQIAGGPGHLGEQIPLPPGQELRELTLAFNKMSRALRRSHDHLEDRVARRTADLTAANGRLEREIAERKRAEGMLRGVIEASPLPMFVIDVDGVVETWNPAAERVFGWPEEEVVGRPLPIVTPSQQEEFEELRSRVLAGESLRGVEIRRQGRDGEMRDLVLSTAAVRDASGRIVGIMAVVDDVTDRKRMERALRESEERYRELVENQGEGIGIVDPDERFVFANPAAHEIFGVAEGDLVGRSLTAFVDEEEYALIREETEVRRAGAESSYELQITRPDEEERTVLITAAPRYGEGGVFKGTFGVFRDITERRRMEEELEEYSEQLEEMVAERTRALREAQEKLLRREKLAMLGQLAGSINHELRGPLGNVKGGVSLLDMLLKRPDEDVEETLEIIDRSVDRAVSIVDSLLAFARTGEPAREEVDVKTVVEEVLSSSEIPPEIEVVRRDDEFTLTLLADREHLQRVFRNLVDNAVEAMPEGGRLTIETPKIAGGRSGTGREVAISVSDTGEGIPKEVREKVFEPLFSTKAQGAGLGLALAKLLVEAHGGTIEVESEVGVGSTFTVRLPLDSGEGIPEV